MVGRDCLVFAQETWSSALAFQTTLFSSSRETHNHVLPFQTKTSTEVLCFAKYEFHVSLPDALKFRKPVQIKINTPAQVWDSQKKSDDRVEITNTMKKCPTCSQTFADDILFCIYDASVLVTSSPETIPASGQIDIPRSVSETPGVNSDVNRFYLIIGGMALIIVGLVFSLVFMYGNRNPVGTASPANPSTGQEQSGTLPNPVSVVENTPAIRETPSKTPTPYVSLPDVDGFWKGKWSTDSGTMLDIEFTLRSIGENRIEGQIKWTMRRTVRPDKKEKIGLSATEYIRGNFDPSTRLLTASGYRKDDPNDVLVMLDNYRLTVSEDGHRLTGVAQNGGRWNGHLDLGRN